MDGFLDGDWGWLNAGVVWGLGGLAGVFLLRFLLELGRSGPRACLRSAFRMEPETWRLIGVLALLAAAAGMVAMQELGGP